MVVLEILKAQYNKGFDKNLYFCRDSKGFEIDLLIADGRNIIPIEIKSASTINTEFCKNLKKFKAFAKTTTTPAVVYSGDLEYESDGIKYVNFKHCEQFV